MEFIDVLQIPFSSKHNTLASISSAVAWDEADEANEDEEVGLRTSVEWRRWAEMINEKWLLRICFDSMLFDFTFNWYSFNGNPIRFLVHLHRLFRFCFCLSLFLEHARVHLVPCLVELYYKVMICKLMIRTSSEPHRHSKLSDSTSRQSEAIKNI